MGYPLILASLGADVILRALRGRNIELTEAC